MQRQADRGLWTMIRYEESFQRSVAEYLDLVLPQHAFWFHVPSGGKRSKAEAGIFKAMGAKAGIPDICIIYKGRAHFIELKAPRSYLSKQQRETMRLLNTAGAFVWIKEVRSLVDVEGILDVWGLLSESTIT